MPFGRISQKVETDTCNPTVDAILFAVIAHFAVIASGPCRQRQLFEGSSTEAWDAELVDAWKLFGTRNGQ